MNLGKPPVCSPRSALRAPSAPLTGQRKGLRPHRCSRGTPSTPTSLARQVGEQGAGGQPAPADPRIRPVEAGAPDKPCSGKRISSLNAEEQSAPADPRICPVEAGVPDKLCPGKLAGGSPAPEEPEVLAVEAGVPAAAFTPLVLAVEPRAPAWAQQIVRFLQTGELPDDPEEIEKITRQSSMYQFVDNELYRRRLNGVRLKCIPREDGQKLLAEIHGGICGHHIGARALVGKAFRQGFFWQEALQDATALVAKCEACQFHAKQIHQPTQALQTIPLSWPFSVWGLDILGPFPRAVGGFEYLY